jgi:MEDS: MEthanogen/methylotroph, DcmR Sensory domain
MKTNLMAKPMVQASADDALEYMLQSNYWEHDMIIYPHLSVLRDIYSRYSKSQLEKGKEIIVLLPMYENISSVKRTLTDGGLDVSRFVNDDSLVILDSVKGYFESSPDILTTIEMLARRVESERGGGCCTVISDMGSFSFLRKENELLEYEGSLPLRFNSMKCKGFCCYHQANFDELSANEREHLLEHHYKNLIITKSN